MGLLDAIAASLNGGQQVKTPTKMSSDQRKEYNDKYSINNYNNTARQTNASNARAWGGGSVYNDQNLYGSPRARRQYNNTVGSRTNDYPYPEGGVIGQNQMTDASSKRAGADDFFSFLDSGVPNGDLYTDEQIEAVGANPTGGKGRTDAQKRMAEATGVDAADIPATSINNSPVYGYLDMYDDFLASGATGDNFGTYQDLNDFQHNSSPEDWYKWERWANDTYGMYQDHADTFGDEYNDEWRKVAYDPYEAMTLADMLSSGMSHNLTANDADRQALAEYLAANPGELAIASEDGSTVIGGADTQMTEDQLLDYYTNILTVANARDRLNDNYNISAAQANDYLRSIYGEEYDPNGANNFAFGTAGYGDNLGNPYIQYQYPGEEEALAQYMASDLYDPTRWIGAGQQYGLSDDDIAAAYLTMYANDANLGMNFNEDKYKKMNDWKEGQISAFNNTGEEEKK